MLARQLLQDTLTPDLSRQLQESSKPVTHSKLSQAVLLQIFKKETTPPNTYAMLQVVIEDYGFNLVAFFAEYKAGWTPWYDIIRMACEYNDPCVILLILNNQVPLPIDILLKNGTQVFSNSTQTLIENSTKTLIENLKTQQGYTPTAEEINQATNIVLSAKYQVHHEKEILTENAFAFGINPTLLQEKLLNTLTRVLSADSFWITGLDYFISQSLQKLPTLSPQELFGRLLQFILQKQSNHYDHWKYTHLLLTEKGVALPSTITPNEFLQQVLQAERININDNIRAALVSYAIQHGADVPNIHTPTGNALLKLAMQQPLSFREVITTYEDINQTNQDQETLLHVAVRTGWSIAVDPGHSIAVDSIVVDCLLEHASINVNLQDIQGNTALHIALNHGFYKTAQTLLMHPDMNIHLPNRNGNTPLHSAMEAMCSSLHRVNAQYITKILDLFNNKGADFMCRNSAEEVPSDKFSLLPTLPSGATTKEKTETQVTLIKLFQYMLTWYHAHQNRLTLSAAHIDQFKQLSDALSLSLLKTCCDTGHSNILLQLLQSGAVNSTHQACATAELNQLLSKSTLTPDEQQCIPSLMRMHHQDLAQSFMNSLQDSCTTVCNFFREYRNSIPYVQYLNPTTYQHCAAITTAITAAETTNDITHFFITLLSQAGTFTQEDPLFRSITVALAVYNYAPQISRQGTEFRVTINNITTPASKASTQDETTGIELTERIHAYDAAYETEPLLSKTMRTRTVTAAFTQDVTNDNIDTNEETTSLLTHQTYFGSGIRNRKHKTGKIDDEQTTHSPLHTHR